MRNSKKKGKNYEELYGFQRTKEIKEKNRQNHLGRRHTIEAKLKMSLSRRGEKNNFFGKHHTETSKLKMSLGISKALKGKKFTEEHKRKISLALKGKSKTEEHKKKLSENKKKLYADGILINPMYRKAHSNEARIKMKYNHANVCGKNNPFYGKCHSKETRKKISEIRIKKGLAKLDNNPAWLGGKSFEPYCPKFNNEFKNLIRIRDNFCCLNCGISEQKHIIITRRKLSIHHIDYNKKNTCVQNCCTLCDSCNTKANKNRISWTKFFQLALSERYGYQYNETKNIILTYNLKDN